MDFCISIHIACDQSYSFLNSFLFIVLIYDFASHFFRYHKILEEIDEKNLHFNTSSSSYADFLDQNIKNEFEFPKNMRNNQTNNSYIDITDSEGNNIYTIFKNKLKNNDFNFEIQNSKRNTTIKEYFYIAEISDNCSLPFKIYKAVKNIILFYSSLQKSETDNILQSSQCVK